jgi:hypothetical protein
MVARAPLGCAALLRRALPLVLALCAPASAAHAADPIMPLSEVKSGMQCTGLSVVRGTEIASFGVEVLDVLAADPAVGGPRILVRVFGPAVDSTGVGPGFSGSPVLCGGRNAGAISEAVGEYGNKVVLATPIEEILTANPPRAAAGARRAPRLMRAARPLAGPLTVSGISTGTRRLLARAGRRAGRMVLAAPPGPLAGYPPQPPVPGAAVSAALSTGDVSVGAVGTVAYRDGNRVFAFGHSLDGLGRRALFLQDAYVFGVIGNPLGLPDVGAITYKLASSGGHPLGSVTRDTFSAIAGRVGAAPPAIPLRVTARRRGRGSDRVRFDSRLADERELGLGASLSFVSALASSSAVDRLLGALEPVTMSACVRFRVRERRRPLGFCNPYFGIDPALGDIAEAAALVESFDLAPLPLRSARVAITASRGVADDVLVAAGAPRRVRAGSRARVRIRVRRRRGGRRTLTVKVPIPRDLRPGPRTLVLRGNGFAGGGGIIIELVEELAGGPRAARAHAVGGARANAAQDEPATVRQLAAEVAALRRPLGIVARLRGREPRVVLRSDEVRFEGRVRVRLRVLPARR